MEFDPSTIETKPVLKPPLMLIYATNGIGKSSFLKSVPGILVADIEGKLSNTDIMRFTPKGYDELMAWLKWCLNQDKPTFNAIGIDSIDWLEILIHRKICKDNRAKSIKDSYCQATSYGNGYVLAANMIKNEVLPYLVAIRNKHNVPIILTCHAAVTLCKAPDVEPYDVFDLKLHEQIREVISERVEAKIYQRIKYTQNQKGENLPTDERVFITSPQKGITAKNNLYLPDEIDISYYNGWKDLAKAINTNKPKK